MAESLVQLTAMNRAISSTLEGARSHAHGLPPTSMEHTAGATATSGEMGGASAPWGQPRLGGQPRPHAAVAPPELNVSKRPRSFTSEYATEPLHPHKQQSDPHGMAVQGGISARQIRQLIQTQRRSAPPLPQGAPPPFGT